MKQLTRLEDAVGKTVVRTAPDKGRGVALIFADETFLILMSDSEEAEVSVSVCPPSMSEAWSLGIVDETSYAEFERQETERRRLRAEARAKNDYAREAQKEKLERDMLLRLKAKYEGSP